MKKKILLCSILLICALTITVFASSYTVRLSVKSSGATSVEVGKTVSLVATLSNISEKGIGVVMAKLEYDTNVFEEVKQENFTAGSGWGGIVYNDTPGSSDKGIFVIERSDGKNINTNNDFIEVLLKVKANAPVGSTEVKLTRN